MSFFRKFHFLTIIISFIVIIDLVSISSIVYVQITSISPPTVLNESNDAIGRTTHNVVIDHNGILYTSWIEKEAKKSSIIFARSYDFGKKWTKEVAFETQNSGIKPDEIKLNNLSMMVDSQGKVHISFMKNIRTREGYGDEARWSLSYITNKGGQWSPPEEIKGPWNSDWMGGIFRTAERRGYSEGVIGLRIDIDSKDVLHIASRHDQWWGWGGALYHHFKSGDSDWKTEEIGWEKVGIGSYEGIRLFYILREMARKKDKELKDIGVNDFSLLDYQANRKIGLYRGDIGYPSHMCWRKDIANVDCYIQGLPLLFVSPDNELYVFNSRLDNNLPYFQKIKSTEFWQNNQLIHSEILPYNEPKDRQIKWGDYKPLYNDNEFQMEHNGLIKTTFDSENNPHLSMISHNENNIFYVKGEGKPETAYNSHFFIKEIEIAMLDDIPHLLFVQEEGKNKRRLFHSFKEKNETWKEPIDLFPLGTKNYSELNIARYSGKSQKENSLPFLGMTFKTDGKQLYFFRATDVPRYLAFKILKNTLIFFVFSSGILFSIFAYSAMIIHRRKPFNMKMAVKFILLLILFLIAKDIFSWIQRDALFLARDPKTLIITLAGIFSTLLFIINSYQRIIKFIKQLFSP